MSEKLSPKEVYKRLLFKEKIQKKVGRAQDEIEKAIKKLEAIRETCPHYDSFFINRGSGGSWDDDGVYWRIYECNDCGAV